MKPETKKAAKARIIAENKAAKEAAKKAEHDRVFATPLAKAVEPLKIAAVAKSEIAAKEWITKKTAELSEVGFDLNKIAPYPSNNFGREEYRKAQNKRMSYQSFTRSVESISRGRNDEPHVVKVDAKKAARSIEIAREMAAMQYEGFVYKMVGKVGAHAAARLETIAGVWGESFLYVTFADGTIQKWKTQTILNCSVYGKIFNQWPSRVVK